MTLIAKGGGKVGEKELKMASRNVVSVMSRSGTSIEDEDSDSGAEGDTTEGADTDTGSEEVSPKTLAIGDSILEWNEEGLIGETGPQGDAGLMCWDTNGNGTPEPEEDRTGDSVRTMKLSPGPATMGVLLRIWTRCSSRDSQFV